MKDDLGKRKDIVILPAVKDRTTVILNRTDYVTKMDTYEPLKKDPTRQVETKLVNILNKWKEDNLISGNQNTILLTQWISFRRSRI